MKKSLFTQMALFLIALQITLRLMISGEGVGDGANLFIHFLPLLVAMLLLIELIRMRSQSIPFFGIEIPLVAYGLISLFSLLSSVYLADSIVQCSSIFSNISLFLIIVYMNKKILKPISLLLIALTASILAMGFIQYFYLFDLATEDILRGSYIEPELQQELIRRYEQYEVFATFVVSNTLAGFLVVVLPFLSGICLDSSFSGFKRGSRYGMFLMIGILVSGFTVLFLTGSLGGWIAILMGGMVFLWLSTRHYPTVYKRVTRLSLVALLIGVSVVAIQFFPQSDSMQIRSVYYQAAFDMQTEHPLGIGLNQFRQYYPSYKSSPPLETVHVHNDYIQMIVELSWFGFLSFLFFIMLILKRSFRFCATSYEDEDSFALPCSRLLFGGGFVGFAIGWMFGWIGYDIEILLIVTMIWGMIFLVCTKVQDSIRFGRYTIYGLIAGISAFLVHMLVDFDLQMFGTSETFYILLAFLVVFTGRKRILRSGRIPMIVSVCIIVLVALTSTIFLLQPTIESDRMIVSGNRSLRRGDMELAEKAYATAIEKDPLRSDAYFLRAELYYILWEREVALKHLPRMMKRINQVVEDMRLGLDRDPRNAGAWNRLSMMFENCSKVFAEIADQRGKSDKKINGMAYGCFQEALRTSQRAVDLYGTHCRYQYRFARLLEWDGQAAEALEHYRRSYGLHLVAVERDLKRLQLSPMMLRECMEKMK